VNLYFAGLLREKAALCALSSFIIDVKPAT
jgi:hypothetical protein